MGTIEKAAKYLEPHEHTKRRAENIIPRDVRRHEDETRRILDYLESKGVDTERPKKRKECPSYRPCPYVSCQYHLYLGVTGSGSIKYNFKELEPHELRPSCALDVAEEGPHTLRETGEYVGLTRERIRQIEERAIESIANKDILDEEAIYEATNSNPRYDSSFEGIL